MSRNLPPLDKLPVPKFSIGQKVFTGHAISIVKSHPCPDCLGTKKWKVITPAGAELEAACQRCTNSYSNIQGIPSLNYRSWGPVVSELTIGKIDADTAPFGDDYVSYMCTETGIGSGTIYYENKLRATREEAEKMAADDVFMKVVETEKSPEAIQSRHLSNLQLIDAMLQLAHDAIFNSWWSYRHLREDVEQAVEGNSSADDLKSNLEWQLKYDAEYNDKRSVFEQIIQTIRDHNEEESELRKLIDQLPYKPMEKKEPETLI